MAQFLQPQQQLAGYEVLELVGKGGMGEVYKARQLSMDRVVALKVLNQRQARQDPAFTKSFIEEARAAGRLGHPNIISVHDVGSTTLPGSPEEVYYFSMELIEGETLKDVIKREGRADEKLIALVMHSMAEALAYAEKHGIVHRDIKPDNIMIAHDRRVKLADLGLALQVGGDQVAEGDAQGAKKVMGTPMYMSPEQARALKIDHRSDQYSLGATLYHLLTGQPPFQGSDAKALMRAHVFDPVPDPQKVFPEVPEPWRQLSMRLMAKSPDGRFANADDLRTAVQAAVRGITLASLSKRTVRILQRREGRRGPWAWIAVAALVVIGGGAAIAMVAGRHGKSDDAGTGPVATDVALDDKAMRLALTALPSDATKALVEIERLRRTPEWNSAHGQALLSEEAKKRQAAQEAARRDAFKPELSAIELRIAGKDLQGAKDALSTLATKHPEATQLAAFKDTNGRLDAAIAALAAGFRERIGKAALSSEVEAAMVDARQAALSGDDIAAIEKFAAKRRTDLASTAAELARAAQRKAWESLATALDEKRRAQAYGDIEELVLTRAGSFPAEAQDAVRALSDLGQMTQNAELAMKAQIERKRPQVDGRIDDKPQKLQLTRLTPTEITYCASDAPNEPRKIPRARASLPWRDLLDQSLGKDAIAAHTKAAALWMWCSPDARVAIEQLGDEPLAHGLRELDRGLAGGLTVGGQVSRSGELVTIAYDLADHPQSLLADLVGDGIKAGDHGLVWFTAVTVPYASRNEASLPRVAWRAALMPPCTIRAAFRLHDRTCLALAGVEAAGRRVRVGFSHRYWERNSPSQQRVGTVVTAADGAQFNMTELARDDNLWPADQPLQMEWTIAEDGRVGATVNRQPIGSAVIGALPAGQPITFILQAYQSIPPAPPSSPDKPAPPPPPPPETTIEMTSLELTGKPPR